MSDEFDFDKALKALQSGQAITGKDGVLTPLIKKLTEAALEGAGRAGFPSGPGYRSQPQERQNQQDGQEHRWPLRTGYAP